MFNNPTGSEFFVSAQQIEQLLALNKLHNSSVGGVGNFCDIVHIVPADDNRIFSLCGEWSGKTIAIQPDGSIEHYKF